MFLKLRRLKGYLSIESEPDIAFSVGYQSKAMSKIRDKSVRVPPLFISILYSVVWALKNYGQLDRDFSRTDFLLLVGSANQEKTVTPILKALKKKRSRVTLLCFSGRNYVSGCILKFGLTDVILALLLILVRRKNLNQLTSSKLTCYQFKRDYKRLLEVYFFLALFDRIIPNKSGVVLVSNDHTAMCRAFCLVAGRKGWKTAYVQHASVTSWFPQLTFDTAFLDGEASLLEYKASSVNPRHAFVSTDVVLVGMQSEPFQEWDADRLIKVGLALNKLFELERVIQLIKALSRHSDFTIVVRLHPSMSVSEISNELVAVGANVELHSASAVPINAFLKDIMFCLNNIST